MENFILRQGIDELVQNTESLQLSERVLERYKKHYESVYDYCVEAGLDVFTRKDAKEFCEQHCKGQKRYAVVEITKIAYTSAEYFETGKFSWKPVTFTVYPICEVFEDLKEGFRKELLKNLSPGTVRTGIVITQQFLYFLEQRSKTDPTGITSEDVIDFVKQESPNHAQSMPKLLRTMRKFVCYLRMMEIVDIDADRILGNTAGRIRQKTLPCFTDEELQSMFNEIDRTCDLGRRDYAIFLLALRTGLRACDISELKLCDIDWKRKIISVIQNKTGRALELPLPVDAGNAIADYILHSRYQTHNPYVFLRILNRTSMEPMHPSAFNSYLQKYMTKAGISKKGWDGKSFHAFRRTAGTRMVEAKVPVTTVAQILGHGSMESSKRYISLDINSLEECGLDLGTMNSRKEGLS